MLNLRCHCFNFFSLDVFIVIQSTGKSKKERVIADELIE